MKRKVIQISTDVINEESSHSITMVIHALCDDGTIWLNLGGEGWNPLEMIPQKSTAQATAERNTLTTR